MTTDLVEKCAIAAMTADGCGIAPQAGGDMVLCDDPRVPDFLREKSCACRKAALAVIDALADGVSDEMACVAEMMLRECEEFGGIDDRTAMRRVIRAAIRAAKGGAR